MLITNYEEREKVDNPFFKDSNNNYCKLFLNILCYKCLKLSHTTV